MAPLSQIAKLLLEWSISAGKRPLGLRAVKAGPFWKTELNVSTWKPSRGKLGGVTGLRVMMGDMVFEAKLLEDDGNFPRVGALAAVESELFSVVCRHIED